MTSKIDLPEWLLGEVSKIALCILNRVVNKSVSKIPFEWWARRQPVIWGCLVEIKIYGPNLMKLVQKQ